MIVYAYVYAGAYAYACSIREIVVQEFSHDFIRIIILCVFCCGGGDALHHYLRCDHLWTLLISCAHLDTKWLIATPAQRLVFVEPNATSLLLITVASRVYHGMEARRAAGLNNPNDPGEECSWALDLINHFLSDIPARLLAPIC